MYITFCDTNKEETVCDISLLTISQDVVIVVGMYNNLKKIRHTLRMSQRAMAASIGLTQPCYANYETGYRRVPPNIAYKLIDFAKSHGIKASLEDIYPRETMR